MDFSPLGPRDRLAAARTAAVLIVVATVTMAGGHAVQHAAGNTDGTALVVAVGVFLVGVGIAVWFLHEHVPATAWLLLALAMVGTIVALDLVTQDAGGGAQVAFLYPVVYAGAFLRTTAAWIVAGAAIVAEGVVVYALLPAANAVSEHAFVTFAIITLTWVLTSAGRRHDRLVGELNALAAADPLTGLATRRALEDAVRFAAADDRPEVPSEGTGLILADIDLFKELNDAYGHPAGDAVLVHTGRVLGTGVRDGDTVARLGGDELALLLPGVAPEAVRQRAEALRRAVRDTPLPWDGQLIHVTVSIGVAHSTTGVADLDALYGAADSALYRAKRDGRNRVVVAGELEHDDEEARRAELELAGPRRDQVGEPPS